MRGTPPDTPVSAGETIRQAMSDLRNAGRQISRQMLVQVTRLPMGIVDDHVTRMIEHGTARRVANGVVELVDVHPPTRPISKTVLTDGTTKIEIGDVCMSLTPSEARVLGMSLYAEAVELVGLRAERDANDVVARLERQGAENKRLLAEARRRIDDLTKTVARLQSQPQLEFE